MIYEHHQPSSSRLVRLGRIELVRWTLGRPHWALRTVGWPHSGIGRNGIYRLGDWKPDINSNNRRYGWNPLRWWRDRPINNNNKEP